MKKFLIQKCYKILKKVDDAYLKLSLSMGLYRKNNTKRI